MQFTLRIEIGNDAMSSSKHLADVLKMAAVRIQDKDYLKYIEYCDLTLTRGINDLNGNYVGEWSLEA
jgi:hypothetical protein